MKKAKKTLKKVKKTVKKVIVRVKVKAKPAPKAVKKIMPKFVKKPVKKAAAPIKPAKVAKPTKTVKVVIPAPEALPKLLKLPKETAAKYKKLLLDLRDHLIDGVNFLATDNLKRSNREASGEISGSSLHMADAGTDNFDREFALSLVSNEQDALYEIEEALKRLEGGTYGLCETCEKQIRRERLEAVPFTKMCVLCQSISERTNHRRPAPVTGIFNEGTDAEGDEKEESED
jgi:RNA polymerase-binding transcription factor DksA